MVNGRQDLGQHFNLGDLDAPRREAFCHFEADVAPADDQCRAWLAISQTLFERKRVAHGVEQVNSVGRPEVAQAVDRRTYRNRAGTDDQFVVAETRCDAFVVSHLDALPRDVDGRDQRVEAKVHAGRLEVGVGAVRKVSPVRDLAGDVVRDAANREVRIRIGNHDGDGDAGV